ncbi:MAG: hypothetical protein A2046_11965 [Bacteroidetes bacterium GWA2_30_7]|nr:MAG: hypothetical protein A2046_11965 [Bacteroidetes bacterium GWA2_30_7]
MKAFHLLTSVFLVLFSILASAQGDKYFEEKQYKVAVAAYTEEVKTKPEKYLNLAKSYFGAKDFKNAIIAMEEYKAKYPKADSAYADWFIEMLKRPDSEVPMRPVQGAINTAGAESVPRISSDGKRIYFKGTDREGGLGGEDIWYSDKQADNTWGKPVLFTALCTNSHETMYAISADGNIVILFGNYEGSFGNGDIFYSVKTANGWSFPCNIGGAINTKKWEAQATLSPDGKTLIFVTNNELNGHIGFYDLYVSNLVETGWSAPVNLGSVVNTTASETRPAFAADGKTLYFSSDGHKGFGGTDIFMTKRLDDSWTNWSVPVNLGKYINTLQSDEDLSVNTAGTIGYTVKENEVGAPGDLDVFQFVIPEIARPEQTITLYGFVTNEKDSAAAVNLRITNMRTNKLQTVVPSFAGDGSYSVNLPFDKFLLEINMKGFLYYSEEIDLSDPSKYIPKKTIRDKIGLETQKKIDELTSNVDSYNKQLNELNSSESTDIKATFEAYEVLLEKYNKALAELQYAIVERKYEWLAEEKKYEDVRKDIKVQRATEGATFKLDNIFFDLGKATLKDESMPALDLLYNILVKNAIDIELGGHTDSIGSSESNIKLSQDRVNSVMNYLLNKGIANNRIVAVGYGEDKPVASNTTDEGRAQNRRVEVKIIDNSPKQREGTEVDLVEKPEEKKKEEPVVVQKISLDFDLLSTLQAAAKIGGLPEGSPCGDKPQYTSNTSTTTTTTTTKAKRKTGSSHSQFDKDDYIYKGFNVGIENFDYIYTPMLLGVNMRFVRRRNFDDNGIASEHNFAYFLKSGNTNWGFGYQYFNFIGFKEKTGLPVGLLWGLETKMFSLKDTASSTQARGYFGIPLGARGLINLGGIVLSPDAYYHIAIVSSEAERKLGKKVNYLVLGANVRWKIFYGGAHLNLGKSINYFGFRAGISL